MIRLLTKSSFWTKDSDYFFQIFAQSDDGGCGKSPRCGTFYLHTMIERSILSCSYLRRRFSVSCLLPQKGRKQLLVNFHFPDHTAIPKIFLLLSNNHQRQSTHHVRTLSVASSSLWPSFFSSNKLLFTVWFHFMCLKEISWTESKSQIFTVILNCLSWAGIVSMRDLFFLTCHGHPWNRLEPHSKSICWSSASRFLCSSFSSSLNNFLLPSSSLTWWLYLIIFHHYQLILQIFIIYLLLISEAILLVFPGDLLRSPGDFLRFLNAAQEIFCVSWTQPRRFCMEKRAARENLLGCNQISMTHPNGFPWRGFSSALFFYELSM